jgi:FkbM family methyltransferase
MPEFYDEFVKEASTGLKTGNWPAKDCGLGYDEDLFVEYPAGECGLVIDVGGNIGLKVLPVASRGYRVLVFEPIPKNIAQLRLNLWFNGWDTDHVGLVAGAASDESGEQTIQAPRGREDNSAMSGKKGATANVDTDIVDNYTIQTVALDDYFAGANKRLLDDVRFIKIDTQGHELEVLHGMKGLLSNGTRNFAVEVEVDKKLQEAAGHEPDAIEKFMVSHGWKVVVRDYDYLFKLDDGNKDEKEAKGKEEKQGRR